MKTTKDNSGNDEQEAEPATAEPIREGTPDKWRASEDKSQDSPPVLPNGLRDGE
jgi:hypothetical protein